MSAHGPGFPVESGFCSSAWNSGLVPGDAASIARFIVTERILARLPRAMADEGNKSNGIGRRDHKK